MEIDFGILMINSSVLIIIDIVKLDMFISKFSTEDWQGNQNHGSIEEAIDWREIETAIRELDGHRRTLVTLETDGETHMAIGSGAGKCLVYITLSL